MPHTDAQQQWDAYKTRELTRLEPLLAQMGYTLDAEQPHTGGERHLTGPLSSGRKLVLLGRAQGNTRVVIKASSEPLGMREIEHEHTCREVLARIGFAYQTLLSPTQLAYVHRAGHVILITEFIEQERPFTERPIEEQFALALSAFKAQESAHATTASHIRLIRDTFGEATFSTYQTKAAQYCQEILATLGDSSERTALEPLLYSARTYIQHSELPIAQYSGFLTHWDFIPQNIRIRAGEMYVLDHSSLHFGNKYEGWARFINFMELYNPPLARALVEYVANNRTPEEVAALKAMRTYRLLELVRYYVSWLPRTQGDLHALARARIAFWGEVLASVLADTSVPEPVVETYKKQRDALRSNDEKRRQEGLH